MAIFEQKENTIEAIGEIESRKVSIDARNIDFITTILSSNLYSNPEKSFIREIVSNAWDSHVEAGTTDIPVTIDFVTSDKTYDIVIRDYGTGLSPERFENIFCKIGSSTKRESNDFIGMFGLGRFAGLACKDTVHFTSYYNGKKYYYIMSKVGNSITFNQIFEADTDEKNGLEVCLKDIDNYNTKYVNSLKYLAFFPNLYVNANSNTFNNLKKREYNNFYVSNAVTDTKVLLGYVLYDIDEYKFGEDVRNMLYEMSDSGICLKFNIGDVEVTPNREQIIYTNETIQLLENKIIDAYNELIELTKSITEENKQDFDNVFTYCLEHNDNEYFVVDLLEKKISVREKQNNSEARTFGKIYFDNIHTILGLSFSFNKIKRHYLFRNFIGSDKIKSTHFVAGNKAISRKGYRFEYYSREEIQFKYIVVPKDTRIGSLMPEYLKTQYRNFFIIEDIDDEQIDVFIAENEKLSFEPINLFTNDEIKTMFKAAMNNSNIFVRFDKNDEGFVKWKEERKAYNYNTPEIEREKGEIVLWNYYGHDCKRTIAAKYSNLNEFVYYKNKGKNHFALFPINSEDQKTNLEKEIILKMNACDIYLISDKVMKTIKSIDWKGRLVNTEKICRKYAAYQAAINSSTCLNPDHYNVSSLSYGFDIENDLKELKGIYCKYPKRASIYLAEYAELLNIKPDSFVQYVDRELSKINDVYYEMKNNDYYISDDLFYICAIKSKKARPSGKTYLKAKNNNIIKILCGRS